MNRGSDEELAFIVMAAIGIASVVGIPFVIAALVIGHIHDLLPSKDKRA